MKKIIFFLILCMGLAYGLERDKTTQSLNNDYLRLDGTTTMTDNLNVGDNNITNVGDIALDSISSDAGTSVSVTLGSDAGDNFYVDGTVFVVEGAHDEVGINIALPSARLDVVGVTGAKNTGNSIKLRAYNPSFQLMDKDEAQNWYMGINDDDGDKLYIGRGYSPSGGLPPAIKIGTGDSVTIGDLTDPGATFNVATGVGVGGGDSIAWFKHQGVAGGNESLIRHEHLSDFSGTGSTPLPVITGFANRGTTTTAVAVSTNDALFVLDGRGHDGTAYSDTSAQISFFANEAWDNVSHGSHMRFYTTSNSTTTPTEHMRISSVGGISPYSRTEAELKAIAPAQEGEIYYDSTNGAIIVSTGTSAGQFGIITNGKATAPIGW